MGLVRSKFEKAIYTCLDNTCQLLIYEGTNGIMASDWEEASSGIQPGDRRMVASCGPFTFTPGAMHELNVAFVVSQQSETTPENHLAFHDMREKNIRLFFLEELNNCNAERETVGLVENGETQKFALYPNPASDLLRVSFRDARPERVFQIFSSDGRLIKSGRAQATLETVSIDDISPGTYLFQMVDSEGILMSRFTIK